MESWNARLREALVAAFDDAGLELLSADIGVDYETLEGTSRPKKAFELVDYCARSGRILPLIDMAAARRPHASADWPAFRAAAIATPESFRLVAATSVADGSSPAALTSAALANPAITAALKVGFIAGALLILMLGCAFSAGIAFGSGSLPLGPRPAPDRASALAVKRAADGTPVGGTLNVALTDGAATALAEDAMRASGVKDVSDVGVRFAANGDMIVTGDVAQLGGRQVALIYNLSTESGRLSANLEGAAVNVLGNSESSFGWVAVPAGFLTGVPSVASAQTQLNRELNNYSVKSLAIQQGGLRLSATRMR
ncbi:MAG TPA: hypothetical protein PLG23_00485 [Thermoflexales bacterium]|jgi:hypothetical protein|nr:hypothetical protein [Anaerolineae bacterium]HQV26457.1 hypothetical protein [Thermoflexales bacterium]HQX11319.1 hypothetical protein [Thermoflexales bacterium]HQZ51905.1 hypothetical protein [Thermoflexales bacterium]HRA52090.1 hypothetical protein [Thermoflexales bacterium]